jgi:hypothetical protein
VTRTPPAATRTAVHTATSTPRPGNHDVACLSWRQKIKLALGILRRLGAEEGERGYQRRFDVNRDGIIDTVDLFAVLAAPSCNQGRRR